MARKKKRAIKKKNKPTAIRIIAVAFICICVIIAGYYIYLKEYKTPTTFNKSKFTIKGVDLSHHNPIINWEELYTHDISFVYLKATGGIKHLDRNYKYNYQSAKNNNIKAGSYHFYLFGAPGVEQARHFIKTANCKSGDLLPAIDVEHSPDNIYSTDSNYVNLIVRELKNLENELYEYYGVHPLIYTNQDCYKLYVKDNFSENRIWMCDLRKEPKNVANWIIWQFSHTGKLEGVDGDIDLNYFRFTYSDLQKILIP